MSRIEKLIARLLSKPKNFTWHDLQKIMSYFGYVEVKGSGSKRKFVRTGRLPFVLHEPHPGVILKSYAVKQAIAHLKEENFL